MALTKQTRPAGQQIAGSGSLLDLAPPPEVPPELDAKFPDVATHLRAIHDVMRQHQKTIRQLQTDLERQTKTTT